MRELNQECFTTSGVSAAGAQASAPIQCDYMLRVSAAIQVAGGTVVSGTAKIQGSNDPPPNMSNQLASGRFFDIPGATTTMNAAGNAVVSATEIAYRWVRLVWTPDNTAAGGTLTAQVRAIGWGV